MSISRTASFTRRLGLREDLPFTTPPPAQVFEDIFRAQVEQGNEVICIPPTAKVSTVFEQAQKAAQPFGGNVHVVESKTISGGLALLVTGAARLARSGFETAAILSALEKWMATQHGYAAYPDLKFLSKSGRINKAQLALGLLMRLFPVTRVSSSGEMETETTVKSWDQAKDMLAGIVSRRIVHPESTRVAITHTNAPELGEFIAEGLRKRLAAPKEVTIYRAGPTIGANVGPGAAGIFMLEE